MCGKKIRNNWGKMLRRRNVNLKNIMQLDVFSKVPETYTKQSAVGGTFSVVTFCIIAYLIYSETGFFLDRPLRFKFEPDVEMNEKLQINVDITVAMPCHRIGADVLDSTNQNLLGIEPLSQDDTWWELTLEQRDHFEALKHMNSYLQQEYHAIHQVLWKTNVNFYEQMPERTEMPKMSPDSCRIHGKLDVNKVAGNFHITSGKSLQLPRGHIHISAFMTEKDYNFTHRINHFSFGDPVLGIVHPLDGDEKFADHNMMLYQYLIEVVPTDVNLILRSSKTYQYSVKDYERPIDHDKGSHGIPGIFFKYDTSALRVKVSHKPYSLFSFLLSICAIVGGVYVTSGIINSIVQNIWYVVCCGFASDYPEEDQIKLINGERKMVEKINLVHVPEPRNIGVVFKT